LVPQPDLGVIASTPSTFGKSFRTSRNFSRTNWQTLAEQLTVEITAT
jgi:hypothetical protein